MNGQQQHQEEGDLWRLNYFNYFTEIEEHFQRARGTGLFLLSPLDWALIEDWKNAGIPLEAVLRGIDSAFDKWRTRKSKTRQMVNSIAYCAQAVMEETQRMANADSNTSGSAESDAPFPIEDVRAHLEKSIAALRDLGHSEVIASLEAILANLEEHFSDAQALDQRLTAIEDKLAAVARAAMPEEQLFQARRELDLQLAPYRGKMTAVQLASLERRFLDRWIFERARLPRLSLFYMR